MELEDARLIVQEMVTEYATMQAWHPDDISDFRETAWEALELLGLDLDKVRR